MQSREMTPTELLKRWASGDRGCLDELVPLVYRELRHIAHRFMAREPLGHTLQTTALINEAYVRLARQAEITSQNRAQFFALAAGVMRHILVDHARGLNCEKRGRGLVHVSLDEELDFSPQKSTELMAIDEALAHLEAVDARKAKVVELRYFGGMTVEEVAQVLDLHPNTVVRDWALAKAWLKRELGRMDSHDR
jgi:RNA polymerase sigma-70 factor (ECF subfamily)